MKSLSSCLGLILQLMRLGICVFLLYAAAADYTSGQASKNWPTVEAKLTKAAVEQTSSKSGNKLEAHVKYDYTVNGQKYSGDRVQFGGLMFRDPSKVIEEIKSTKHLSVHYNPAQPDVSSIETGLNLNFVLLEVAGAILMVVLAVQDELKKRKENEINQSWTGDRHGKKLSSMPGLKEQKEFGVSGESQTKNKSKQAIFMLVFLGLVFAIATAIEHIEIPGVPAKVLGMGAMLFAGLVIVMIMSSTAPLVAILVRRRQLALAESLAKINAAVYSGFSSSFELALARGLQAEVAQERLHYDKALSFSKMALNVMAERKELLHKTASQKSSVLGQQAIDIAEKQYCDLESLCNESIGGVYFDMGKYDDAMKHAKEAVRMAEELLKTNDTSSTKLALACALTLKGRTENVLGNFDNAKSDLNRAMTIRKETSLPYPERLALVMSYLASTYTNRGEYRAAERLLDEGLQTVEGSSESAMQLAKATIHFYRAEMKMHLEQYMSAQELLNQCIALREEFLLQNHPQIAEAYLLSAKLNQQMGRSSDAARQKAKALSMLHYCFGDKHPMMDNNETIKSKQQAQQKLSL